MKRVLSGLLIAILLAVNAYAADVFVDKDNSCAADDGSSGQPWCTIQAAFDVVNPGDVIKIRDSATCYDANSILTRSGTSGSRITIQPDSGHNPCIRFTSTSTSAGAMEIQANHVTVQNLTFNGASISPSRYALVAAALTADLTGIIFTGNTVLNWGNAVDRRFVSIGARADDAETFFVRNIQVTNNTITDGRSRGIYMGHTDSGLVQGNTITGLKCGFQSTGNSRGAQGIKVSDDGMNNLIKRNFVHTFSTDCTGITAGPNNDLFVGLYCDTGSTTGTFEENEVHDIVSGVVSNPDGVGIFVESRCHDWVVKNNVVWNIGRYGIRNGSGSGLRGDRTKWHNNSINATAGTCAWLRNGISLQFQNNICVIAGTGVVAIEVHADAVALGGHTINGNLYYDGGAGTKIGRWGNFTALNFTNWKSACNCDASSPTPAAPPFTSATNLTLTSLTNMNGVAVSPVLPFNGASLPLIGAYDPPRLTAGNCTTPDSTHLQLVFTNNKYPNMAASAATTGWTLSPSNTLNSAIVSGQTITFELNSAYGGADDIEVTYNSATGNITDSAPFTNKQKFLSVTSFQCTNSIGGGGSTPVLTQHAFQFYGLRLEGGLLVKAPHSAANLNTNIKIIPRGIFTIVIQANNTVTDNPGSIFVPHISYKGGAYAAATDAFTNKIRYLGLADGSVNIPTQGGNPIVACLDGALDIITGSIQRTSAEIPTLNMTTDSCVALGYIFEVQDTVDSTDYWEIRLYRGTVAFTVGGGAYTVTPRATGIGPTAGF